MHDTHAHLDIFLEQQGQLDPSHSKITADNKEYLNTVLKQHDFIIHPTVSLDNYRRVVSLFSYNPKVSYLFGSHPEIVTEDFDIESYMVQCKEYLKGVKKHNFIGFGEVGLDYYYTQDKHIIQLQQELFEEFVRLSIIYDKPLIIHCRDAWEDIFKVLDKHPQIHGKFLIHCFTGTLQDLRAVQQRGGLVAYGGIVTFSNSKELQNTVEHLMEGDYVLETDLPYLSPHPYRGRINQPVYIDHIAQKIADIQGLSKQKVWDVSNKNTQKFFDIS